MEPRALAHDSGAVSVPPPSPRLMQKLLIIDQDQPLRRLYSYLFTEAGYKVETASTGEEGLAKAARLLPDCILIDERLLDITGQEFTERLNAARACGQKNVPAVFLMSASGTGTHMQSHPNGFYSCRAFVPKITDTEIVLAMVRKTLQPKELTGGTQA